ncbi:MAG: hypothetical protein JNJ90_16750 [Saprospiraceae bacterium]|nr:hypothetical protein [Saprospiraceae bacterium]
MNLKHTLLLMLFLPAMFSAAGQTAADTIEVRKAFGTVFRYKGKNQTPKQLLDLMAPIPEAYKEMEIARSNNTAGTIFGAIGGFMVGWQLGSAIGGGDPNWSLAAVGAGVIVISIPFSTAYTRHAKNAVALYNGSQRHSALDGPELHLGMTGNGMGLRLSFP